MIRKHFEVTGSLSALLKMISGKGSYHRHKSSHLLVAGEMCVMDMHGEGLSENQSVTPLSPYSEAFLLPYRENKENQGDRQAVHDGRCVPEM